MKKKTKAKAAAKRQPKESAEGSGGLGASRPTKAEYQRERREISISLLKAAPWNPRGEITPESVADLAASIGTLGVIQPLVAMLDKDNNATLIAGHRRLAAAKMAGLESVPCDILKGVDEETAKRMTFIENLQRKDADPLLESELVGGLVKSGMTQAEIAAETGRGREWVARRVNLANLSKSWRKRVKDGERITTDCLEHVAAYPEEVQEALKNVQNWKHETPMRWNDVRGSFGHETCDLKEAMFDRAACKKCPNNTGCVPDLFDWEGRVTAFGKCLDKKCYAHLTQLAIQKAKDDAKKDGLEVRELKEHPDYSISLQSKPDKRHNTLYVWKDYNGEPQMQWGEAPKQGKADDGRISDEEKEARKRKIAANKARRKLAEWCGENLAGAIARRFPTIGVSTARAFQTLFDIGSSWRVFGSQTNATDAARAHLLDPDAVDMANANWPNLAAPEIAAKIVKAEIGARYAELLLAILPETADALTDEERLLVASDETLAKLREPVRVKWTEAATDDEAEDAMLSEEDDEEGGAE